MNRKLPAPIIFFLLFNLFFPLSAAEHTQKKPLSVVIIGGGPAGLATAIEARQRGAKVTIVEKRESYSRVQSVLLFSSALQQLRDWQIECPQLIVSKTNAGAIVGVVTIKDLEMALARRVKKLGARVIRGTFKQICSDRSGSPLVLVSSSSQEFCLPYEILIGADGASSCVRQALGISTSIYGKAVGAFAKVAMKKPMKVSVETTKPEEFFFRRITFPPNLCFLFAQSLPNSMNSIPSQRLVHAAKKLGWEEEAQSLDRGRALTYVDHIEIVLQQAQGFSDEQKAAILVGDAAATGSFFDGKGANTAFRAAGHVGDFIANFQNSEKAYSQFNTAMQKTTDALIEESRYLFQEK